MRRRTITPAQQDVLELLSAYHYCATRQVWEEARLRRSKRATEQLLARLRQAGLITACPLRPEQGRASAWGWRLLPAGAAALGQPYHPPPQPPASVTPPQRAVLQLLHQMKQLTTTQIGRHLHPGKSRSYTYRVLVRLRMRTLITSAPLEPLRGRNSEHYWMLRPAGCAVLRQPYSTHYTRRPSPDILRQREAQLALQRQVAAVGWQILEPVVYNTVHRRPKETPQARQMITAVLAAEQETLRTLLARGSPPQQLEDRFQLWRGGHVGAVVPHFVNDYVAYPPDQPQHTAVFILPPIRAGSHCWTQRPTRAKQHTAGQSPARLEQYRRLAAVLPVIVLFLSNEAGVYQERRLARVGLRWSSIADLAANWTTVTQPPPRR